VPEADVKSPRARAFARAHALTGAVWAAGIALQLAASLMRDRVPLSDDLFITSMIAPAWSFLQVCLLAGALRLTRRRAEPWSTPTRVAISVGAAIVFMLLQPGIISMLLAGPAAFSPTDKVALALLWSTPLALYVVPAGIVVWAWALRNGRVSLPRALGYGLVAQGVLNFAFIAWLNHLWQIYVKVQQPTGP